MSKNIFHGFLKKPYKNYYYFSKILIILLIVLKKRFYGILKIIYFCKIPIQESILMKIEQQRMKKIDSWNKRIDFFKNQIGIEHP